jgi:two-component system CheB/CheR fusion protein
MEVTERKFMMKNTAQTKLLNRYEKLGVGFALDDFGTGYSNLSYLSEMPFDYLKIDRSFVEKIGKSNKSEEIIKASIAIAKALALKTIAEGIETKEEFEFLVKNGCDLAQGFYIQTPEPIEKLIPIINSKAPFLVLDRQK